MAERSRPGRVERATRSELRRLDVSVQASSPAALAVALAEQIDRARGAVAAAAAAAQLRLTMTEIRALAQARKPPESDGIDDLAARRAERRGTG